MKWSLGCVVVMRATAAWFGVSSFQSSQLIGVLWTDATNKLRNVALGKERIKQNLVTDFVLMSDRLRLNCLPLRRILVTCHVARTAVDA
jgi:hypothetical protein